MGVCAPFRGCPPSPFTRSGWTHPSWLKTSKTLAWDGRASRHGLSSKYSETRFRSLDPPERVLQIKTRFAGRPKTSGLLAFGVPPQGRKHTLQDCEPARLWPGAFAGEPARKIPSASYGSISLPLADLLIQFLRVTPSVTFFISSAFSRQFCFPQAAPPPRQIRVLIRIPNFLDSGLFAAPSSHYTAQAVKVVPAHPGRRRSTALAQP